MRYIQISDLHGNLIHIHPAIKIETWTVAYESMKNAYARWPVPKFILNILP